MRSRRQKQDAEASAKQWIESNSGNPPGFCVKNVSPLIGRGLFAERKFCEGEFLIEYGGIVTDASDFEETAADLTYVYYFKHGRKELCVDATSSKSFGKYANDEWRNPNAKVQKIVISGKPHLILVARRDINPEEEIRYDYGKRDAEWRKKGFQDNDSGLSGSSFASTANEPITLSDATITTSMAMDNAALVDKLSKSDAPDTLTDMVDAKAATPTQSAIDLSSKDLARLLDRNKVVPESPLEDSPEPRTMDDATVTSNISIDEAASVDDLGESDALDTLTDMGDAMEDTPTQSAINLSSKGCARLLDRNKIVPEIPVEDGLAPITMNTTVTMSISMDDAASVDDLSESDALDTLTDMEDAIAATPTQSAIDLSSKDLARLLDRNKIVPESPLEDSLEPRTMGDATVTSHISIDDAASVDDLSESDALDTRTDMVDAIEDTPKQSAIDLSSKGCARLLDKTEIVSASPVKDGLVSITMNDAAVSMSLSIDDAASVDELSESYALDTLTDMVDAIEDTPKQSAIDLSSNGCARLLDRNEIVPESPVKDGPAPLIDIRNISSTSRGMSEHWSKNGNLRPRSRTMYYAETSSSEDSGSEYECSDNELDSDDSNASLVIPPPSVGKLKSTPDPCCVVSSSEQMKQSSDVLTDDGNVKRKNGITIPTTHNTGQRKWDKVDYCIFCNESKTKLCTHLKAMHSSEVDVIDWLQTKDNPLKLQKLRKMRNIGNHRHNCEVLRQGSGELVVTYRPSPEGIPANPDDYGPCPYCYAYFVKREMWKHRCPERLQMEAKKKRTVLKDSNLLVPSLRSGRGSEHLDRVLAGMKLDSVSRCVKSDSLILDVAERECFKLGHNVEQDSYVRGKLRELGRLLLQLRETFGNPEGCLEDFIYPEKFKTVVIAVRDMCGFSDQSHVYSTPSLALKVGHTLKKVATVLKGQGLENGDDSLYRRASAFHDLCEMRWTEEVSSHALRTLYSRKRNNPQILPLTADIACLANYTKKVASEQMSILSNDQNGDIQAAWVTLAEMSLTRIITFNRRRQGEASKMKLCDYTSNCSTGVKETALEETFTELEKALCKSLSRVEIVGKRGNTVPVILTADMKQQLDMLNAKRDQAGISKDNPYIFARACKGSNNHIRGSDCLRKAAEACGAKQPQSLRSTKLRKHIATVSQVLHLNENELEVLAKFMGHDIRTHRAYYRLPDETMQLAKMSKFLLSLEKPGSLKALAGKSWKDMEIDECEEAEEDVSQLEDSDQDAAESDDLDENSSVAEGGTGEQSVPDSTTSNAGSPDVPVRKRKPWSDKEKDAIWRHLSRHILMGRLPGKQEIEATIRKEKALSSRSWRNVKDFCRNQTVSKARKI